ncbi:hypothetical protein CO614_02030 [Lysobacteraceae bacterium NML120232]|nr:hypothetical protein CO614_02030 [Xanthomonadaceae bacterium NML120232]
MEIDVSAGRDIVLTGVPRSGTTLSCRLLNDAADTVALFEPMQVELLPVDAPAAAVAQIHDFLAQSRSQLLHEGQCWSQHVDGQVPDNPVSSRREEDGSRLHQAVRGRIRIEKPLRPDFTLAIKHNAAFTALLPALIKTQDVYGIIRNPVAVLGSWHSVGLPVSQGRLPAGERLCPRLRAQLADEADLLTRQLIILDWFFGRFAEHLPAERVSRYEQLVESHGQSLAAMLGLPLPARDLQSRNSSRLYDAEAARHWTQHLLARGGAWSHWYGRDEILAAAAALAGAQ